MNKDRMVIIDYTNYRGERSERVIVPAENAVYWGSTEWHPEPQWLLNAFDPAKGEYRIFAVKCIHAWRPVPPPARILP